MLRVRLQEEALRTYLITYGAHYDSISLSHLCTTFEMEEGPARRVISRMIFNKEIAGGWEHAPAETLVLHKVEPTNLQVLTQQVAEKVAMLVESNERMLDPLVNVYGYKDDQRRPWGGEREPSDRRRGAGTYTQNTHQITYTHTTHFLSIITPFSSRLILIYASSMHALIPY